MILLIIVGFMVGFNTSSASIKHNLGETKYICFSKEEKTECFKAVKDGETKFFEDKVL